MTLCHVFIATSLDGYIARPNGDIEWLNKYPANGEDYGYGAFMERMDGIVMGRGTFMKALSFATWPYEKPIVVMSRSLSQNDLRSDLIGRVRVTNDSPQDLMLMLSDDKWRHVYVDGGKIIQSFLREKLIADLMVTRIPVLLGDGISLFGSLVHDIHLKHLDTTAFASGFVQSKYEVLKEM